MQFVEEGSDKGNNEQSFAVEAPQVVDEKNSYEIYDNDMLD